MRQINKLQTGAFLTEEPDEGDFLTLSLQELNDMWFGAAISWQERGADVDRSQVEEPDDIGEARPPSSLLEEDLRRLGGPLFAGIIAARDKVPDEMLYGVVREMYDPRDFDGQFFITSFTAGEQDGESVKAAIRKVKGALLIAAIDHHFRSGSISAAWRGVDAADLADVDWAPVLAFVLTLPIEEQRSSLDLIYGRSYSPSADNVPRLAALRLLVPHLSQDQVDVAFVEVAQLMDPIVQRIGMELIAPRLGRTQVAQALQTLNIGADVREQAWFLNQLAGALDPADDRRSQIMDWSLEAATTISSGQDFGTVVSLMMGSVAGAKGTVVSRDGPGNDELPSAALLPAEKVLAALRALDYNNRCEAIGALARATSGPLPSFIVTEVLDLPVANAIGKFSPRGFLISVLSDRFPEESLVAVFRAAMELPDRFNIGDSQVWGWNWSHEYPKGSALYSLAPRLRGKQAETAFAASCELPWMAREEILQRLAPHADSKLARSLFDYSFEIHPTYMELSDSAPIPYGLEQAIITEPLPTFKIFREVHLAEIIAATAAKLDPERLDRAIAQAQAFNNAGPRAWLPARLLPLLSEDHWEPMLSSAVVATMECIGDDPSRLDLITDLLPSMRREMDRRREKVFDFVENLIPGERRLLTRDQFMKLPAVEQQEYRNLMGLNQLEELAAIVDEADDDTRRRSFTSVVLAPVNAASMQAILAAGLSAAPLDARLGALENMKQILQEDSHASVVETTVRQVLQAEMEPIDRVRRVSALLPHVKFPLCDDLVDVAFQLPGPPDGEDETLCAEILNALLRGFSRVLREDPNFGENRHNRAAHDLEVNLADRANEALRQRRGPRVQLLEEIAASLSENGLCRAITLMLELPPIERADGIAALIKSAQGDLREHLIRALFELESPFGRMWSLFNSQDSLLDEVGSEFSGIARSTAESFIQPRNVAGCMLILIGYAEDQKSWIRRILELCDEMSADDKLEILAVASQMVKDDLSLTRAVIEIICGLPTLGLVYTGLVMAARLNLDIKLSSATVLNQLRIAVSHRLRFASQRGRAELLRILADEGAAITAISTADGISEMGKVVHDVCVEWQWPSRV